MEKQRDKAARRAQRKAERELTPGGEAVPIEPFEDYLADSADDSVDDTADDTAEASADGSGSGSE